jgi:hypothetical protein
MLVFVGLRVGLEVPIIIFGLGLDALGVRVSVHGSSKAISLSGKIDDREMNSANTLTPCVG